MKKGSFIITMLYGRPGGYTNYVLDDPVYEIRSLDPTLRIIENIVFDAYIYQYDAIQVFVENDEQYDKLSKYCKLRENKITYFYVKENEHPDFCNHFNYKKSREVGHILFAILQMVRAKHHELTKISKSGFVIYQEPYEGCFGPYEYKNKQIVSMNLNGHKYSYSKGIDDELLFEEDGLVIEEYSPQAKKWFTLKNPYIPYEVGDYTFEQAMKYTNNIKPNILQKKQSTK